MAENDSDHFARMLHALSSGEQSDEESQAETHDEEGVLQEPATPAPDVQTPPGSATPKPTVARAGPPVPRPSSPRTAPPAIQKPAAPRPAAPRPGKPTMPTARPAPAAPRPVQGAPAARPASAQPGTVRPTVTTPPPSPAPPLPPPPAPIQVVEAPGAEEPPADDAGAYEATGEGFVEQEQMSDEEVAEQAEMEADDQVMIPAPPTSVLAHHPHRPHVQRRHFVQSLGFKQAMIPISFTLAAVCMVYVIIGMLADSTSPFAALGSPLIAGTFALIGLVMLVVGFVTVFQVKHELKRSAAQRR